MNKKMILSVLLTLLALTPVVLADAIYTPLPIDGQITGFSDNSGFEIQVTNLRTGEKILTTSVSEGYYLIDWANSILKYQNGDQFRIEVTACSNLPNCVKSLTYTGQPELNAVFDLSGIPTTTTLPTTTTTIPTPQPGYDWNTFITGGGIIAFLSFLAFYFGAYKGRVRIQVYKKIWNETTKKWTYKWVTVFGRSD